MVGADRRGGRPLEEWLLVPRVPERLDAVCARAVRGTSMRAEDLRQTVFVDLVRDKVHFATPEDLLRWVAKAARHRVADHRKSRYASVVDLVAALDESDKVGGDHVEALLAGFAAEAVQDAVAALPPQEREAVRLRYYDRLTYSEAADVLGIPVPTLQRRLGRAYRHLRRLLAAQGYGPLTAMSAALLMARPRRALLTRPSLVAASAVVLSLHSAAGWLLLPHRTGLPVAGMRPAAALEATSPPATVVGPVGPVPHPPVRAVSPQAVADRTGPATVRVDLHIDAGPAGQLCAGTQRPPHCEGDFLYVQTPDDIRHLTGGATDPVDGTGVASKQVPLCKAPNTPATRCEPHAPPAEE